MSKPENFIQNSDYASLKNDDRGSVSVTFPASQSVASNGLKIFYNTIDVGTSGASARVQIASSKDSNKFYSCTQLTYQRDLGGGFSYTIVASYSRTSSSTMTVYCFVYNQTGFGITTLPGDETFTFSINTFLDPFS